jgi:hypothetical protein
MTSEQSEETPGGILKEMVIMVGLIGALVASLTVIGTLYWMQSMPEAASAATPAAAKPVDAARPSVRCRPRCSRAPHRPYFDFSRAA